MATSTKRTAKETAAVMKLEPAKRAPAAEEKDEGRDAELPLSERQAVIYIGHIPHGFYEKEMRGYLTQYGEVKRLVLSRSRKTGNSKGWGFVQFEDTTVAKVVAEALNGYPLMEKVLVSALVPPAKVHPYTFRYANKKWKKIPWRQVIRSIQIAPKTDRQASRRMDKLLARERTQAQKLAAAGIDFDFPTTYAGLAIESGLVEPVSSDDEEEEGEEEEGGAEEEAKETAAPVVSAGGGAKKRRGEDGGAVAPPPTTAVVQPASKAPVAAKHAVPAAPAVTSGASKASGAPAAGGKRKRSGEEEEGEEGVGQAAPKAGRKAPAPAPAPAVAAAVAAAAPEDGVGRKKRVSFGGEAAGKPTPTPTPGKTPSKGGAAAPTVSSAAKGATPGEPAVEPAAKPAPKTAATRPLMKKRK